MSIKLEELLVAGIKPKIFLSKKIQKEISFLCENISKEEWSGVLFYTAKGTINEPSKLQITLESILPLDKGSAAYTEYEFDERFINHITENPDLMEMRVGHIHSHNTMNTFFSGTDKEELIENSGVHNYYLSVIVNNYGSICAKICTIGEISYQMETSYQAKNEAGELYNIQDIKLNVSKKKAFIYDCDIKNPHKKTQVDEVFSKQVTEIIEKKKVIIPVQPRAYYNQEDNPFNRSFPKVQNYQHIKHEKHDWDQHVPYYGVPGKSVVDSFFDEPENSEERITDSDEFIFVKSLAGAYVQKETIAKISIEQAVHIFAKSGIRNTTEKIVEFFNDYSNVLIEVYGKDFITKELYVEILEEMYLNLIEYMEDLEPVEKLVIAIENHLLKFKN